MEAFLFSCMIVVLVIRWFWLRSRLEGIDARLNALAEAVHRRPMPMAAGIATPERPPVAHEAPRPAAPPPPPPASPRPAAAPVPWTDRPRESAPAPAPASTTASTARPKRTSEDWEALLGGNWLNKIGVFVVVIGLALLLNYAYTHIGPGGRIALSYTGAFAMLGAGIAMERRETYRTFAYGLIGGGWAALYLTTYAMHAIEAARVLDNPWIAAVLLFAVAAGMIAHSLRYRSQTVAGLAYFIAFVTLGISEVTLFSAAALVPLAASLLFIARRNHWERFARFGLLAT
ncbi:MAG: DUF2339 domain-containing protein, partial [Acidobacteria bacterium]|nr:DUF2339 domain-containing protein [Acidobacteriota bacterium]